MGWVWPSCMGDCINDMLRKYLIDTICICICICYIYFNVYFHLNKQMIINIIFSLSANYFIIILFYLHHYQIVLIVQSSFMSYLLYLFDFYSISICNCILLYRPNNCYSYHLYLFMLCYCILYSCL